MMIIKNPNYKSAAILKAETAIDKLTLYMGNLPQDQSSVTFETIRQVAINAGIGLVADDLPDGYIAHVAELAGFEISGE